MAWSKKQKTAVRQQDISTGVSCSQNTSISPPYLSEHDKWITRWCPSQIVCAHNVYNHHPISNSHEVDCHKSLHK
jgi:hypothetical protein